MIQALNNESIYITIVSSLFDIVNAFNLPCLPFSCETVFNRRVVVKEVGDLVAVLIRFV